MTSSPLNSPSMNPSSSSRRMSPYCPSSQRWVHGRAGQPERMAALLMPGQVVPEPLDQSAEQLVDFLHMSNAGSSPPQRSSTNPKRRDRNLGVAILPRKRVRTSWNGTGHPCFAIKALAAFSRGPLAAFFIPSRNSIACNDRLAAIGRQGTSDSLASGAPQGPDRAPTPRSTTMTNDHKPGHPAIFCLDPHSQFEANRREKTTSQERSRPTARWSAASLVMEAAGIAPSS